MSAIADSVFHSRALRTPGLCIEDDPEPMVQQQLARLKFMAKMLDLRAKRVLEFGCGTGFNIGFIKSEMGASRVAGFDNSQGTIALAKQQFPGAEVAVGDACNPLLDISPGNWDAIVSFEVLEHVPDMPAFLANMRRHLRTGGVVLISTPNREVFSSGNEPSPMNREHIKELSATELVDLVRPFFTNVELWGQRFKTFGLQKAWDDDVKSKIAQLRDGTRWKEASPESLTRRVYKGLHPSLKATWKYLRWNLIEAMNRRRQIANRQYGWDDFEFTQELDRSLWFCAIMKA